MFDQLKGKKGIFVFSDPAGAKACLAIAASLDQNDILVISDREYSFFFEFKVLVNSVSDKSANAWIDHFKPDFLFTGTSYPEKLELSFIKEATKRNIKSFSFVDHWINIKLRFVSDDEIIYPYKILLIDNVAKQKALLEGIPENLLEISGNPYYEFLKKWKPSVSKRELFKKLGLDNSSKYILYAPEPLSTFNLQNKYGFDEVSGLKHLDASIDNLGLSNIFIIVKGHPNQNDKLFFEYISKSKSQNIVYLKDFDLNLLFFYSEAVVGYFSNSLIEAKIMNKKIIRILIDLIDINLDPFKDKEIGIKTYNINTLMIELNNIFK